MAKKEIKELTPHGENYSQQYQDVVAKVGLTENPSAHDCTVTKPYGYGIWEKMRQDFDCRFKEAGYSSAYFPLFIPKSHFNHEVEHVEGFARECAIVTHYRLRMDKAGNGVGVDPNAKLKEELIVRPTSETIIRSTCKGWIQSYCDLSLLCNQWASVVRWEMRMHLFPRTVELLRQEGHTAHTTQEGAIAEAYRMIGVYEDFTREMLALPVIVRVKSETERFAGTIDTYTIEVMIQDGEALQSGTSHFLEQNFAKAFDATFLDKEGNRDYVWATSWSVSTRLVGALITAYSDNNGLVLPPCIAPTQVVIVPIYKSEEELQHIHETADKIVSELRQHGVPTQTDDNDNKKPRWKLAEYEMKSVPVHLALGMRDLEYDTVEVARRDILTKETMPPEGISAHIGRLFEDIQSNLYNRSLQSLEERIYICDSYDESGECIEDGGFFLRRWDGTAETETRIKEETKAAIHCIPRGIPSEPGRCMVTGRPSKCRVIVARSY